MKAAIVKSPGLATRLRHMACGWGGVWLVYCLCWVLAGPAQILHETFVDQWLPFTASATWVYLSFVLLVPWAYLACEERRLRWLVGSMLLSAAVSGLFFLLWPTTLIYPSVAGHSLAEEVWRFVAAVDSDRNCLPSLHASLTILSVVALLARGRPIRNVLVIAWGIAVVFSIVLSRRHLALDVGAGLLGGLLCGAVVAVVLPATRQGSG
ncbi:MAG: inositol phosphorylceramide synthase [Pseudomonadota bacterium]